MGEFFLGMMEITIGMSIMILLMLFTLKLIGGKFTAKCRYILWTLVMIRLAVPVSFGILPALIEVPVETEPVQQIQMQVPTVNYTPTQQNPVTVQPQEQVQIPPPTVQTPVFTEPEPNPLTWEDVKAYIPHAYLTGAAVFLLWNLLAYGIYTAKILRSAREADDETKAIYDAVCRKKGLRRMPKLLVSPDVNSPAAFGLLFRRIVLPDIALTENGLTGTLSHEVTHCKRGDLWIKAICLLARSLHWFNPLVHLVAFRCEMEMELSCDEAVLIGCDENTRAAYGEVMLDIIKRCRRNRGALTTHFNPKKNAVKARFANILYGSGKRRGLWLIAVCLVLCLVAGAIVACRTAEETKEETRSESVTEPLPDGETLEIPLIYTPYTQEISQDMFVEEIPETELAEILQDQELCGVRVILYLDENELFCAAYEKDDTLFRFIRTGGVEPVSYAAEEFSDVLEADGFTVSWSWSHRFRAYFTVEDGAPKLYLDAYDNVTEADYDNDGVTEVICQSMINVDIYDISEGVLQTVSFDSELTKPKQGEFYRYLPEKNWFEFDYKKDGDDTLYHRYGVVEDGVLTLVTLKNDEEDTVSSSLVNILSQNSDLQMHTVYIPVDGQNPEYTRYSLDDRYTIFQTYDRTDRGAEEWIADNIMLWVVDALTGTIAASFNVDDEWILNEISYTDTGCVLYRWENRNGIIVARYAVQIENNNGAFTFSKISMDAYPQKLNYVRTPDGTALAYRTVEDIDGNHGIDVKYADGTVKRILNGEIGSVQSTVIYRPIAFLDGSRLVYSVLGGKYHISFGIYNIVTHENMLMDGAYSCLGVYDGVVYAAYENGGDFNYGIYESELWAIYADGTKNMLAATHNVTDGITALSMEEYYLFKNGMWVFYETGDISGYAYYDDPSKKLKVRLVSPDMQTTLLEAEYPYIYDCTGLLMTCGDSVTIAVPVTTKKTMNTGTYPTVEAYINERMAQESTITYYSVSRHHANPDGGADEWTATANVVDTKLVMFEKKGELDGLASDGVLECWEYRYHLKLDVPTDDVMTVDGDFEGWFDMVGQHTVVALRYPNGTYSILMDEMTGDGIDFGGYHDTYEEAIYDWYVTEYGLDLPLYVEDWTDEIATPNGEYIGNHPVHRFDGDGWGIYIPIAAWYQAAETVENQWLWCSSYLNGSALLVEEFGHSLEDEYVTAGKQGYTPTDRTNRVWEDHTDGTHSYYYYYENPKVGFWRVTIEWTDEGVSSENPNVVIEPQLLKLMAESFVVFGETYTGIPTSPTVEDDADAEPKTIWQNFLDTVVSPYSEYIVATEFLDLDGNGIDELIIYNWGASANCGIEIFTIENGEVRSFSTTTSGVTHYSGKPKSLAPPSANAVDYSFWGLPTSYSDKSDVILWFVPCDSRKRNGHVLYSMNGSDVHTSEDYYYFTTDANGNLTVEVLRSYYCEAIDSNPANGWKCYIFGEEVSVRWFHDTMGFFWQDLAVTHGVQYHDKNTTSRYAELEAWMEPPLDASALLEKNLAELRQMEGNQYRAIEAILSGNSTMLEAAMKLPEGTGQMFTGITLASWAVDRISDDGYFNPIRLTLEITESSSSVFPVGTSRWIVDEGMDGVTLTNYENPVVRNPDPTTDAEEAVWTWLRATGQVILPLNTEMTAEKTAEFAKYATEYACRHADGTLNSIRNMVKTCFGSEEYFSDEILYTGDGVHYGAGAHGAARHSYDWLGTTENKDGSISVKMLFYADPSKFIPAKTVEYTLIPTGEDSYGQTVYFFRSCEIVEDTGYSAYFKWT